MRQARRGAILLSALMLTALVATLLSIGQIRAMNESSIAQRSAANQQAFALAEAGLDAGIQWVIEKSQNRLPECSQPTLPGNQVAQECQGGTTDDFTPDVATPLSLPGVGDFTVTVDPGDENGTDPSSATFTIRATGTTVGAFPSQRTVTVALKRESFSKFLMYYKRYANNAVIYFSTNETMDGPVYTGGNLYLKGTPTFKSTVEYVGAIQCDACAPRYEDSPPKRVEEVPLPDRLSDFPNLVQRASDDGLRLKHDTTVTMLGDKMKFAADDDDVEIAVKGTRVELDDVPDGGQIQVKGITVSRPAGQDALVVDLTEPLLIVGDHEVIINGGELHGKVTLASHDDMTIKGNIVYACNPDSVNPDGTPVTDEDRQNDPDCDEGESLDLLGLVSRNNIAVDTAALPNVGVPVAGGPGADIGLTIHGSVMALKTFYVKGGGSVPGDVRNDNLGYKGLLHLFGGLIQDRRGYVGWNINQPGADGFDKDYVYDIRLLRMTPPSFPTTGRYEFLYWDDTR